MEPAIVLAQHVLSSRKAFVKLCWAAQAEALVPSYVNVNYLVLFLLKFVVKEKLLKTFDPRPCVLLLGFLVETIYR